jgi:hypothetical protein
VTLHSSGSGFDRDFGEHFLVLYKFHTERNLIAKSCNISVGKNLILIPIQSIISNCLFLIMFSEVILYEVFISSICFMCSARFIPSVFCDEIIFA